MRVTLAVGLRCQAYFRGRTLAWLVICDQLLRRASLLTRPISIRLVSVGARRSLPELNRRLALPLKDIRGGP